MEMFQGFEPVYDSASRVLIVGSFPSVKSREQGFYYGNKQNRFWKMLSICFEEEIDDNIEEKKRFLHKNHIALYDAILESDIIGSADESLIKSNYKVASIDFLLPPNTKVEKIICNGKAAFNLLKDALRSDVQIICLSSTSSANPRFDIEEWKRELKFIQ